MFYFFISPPYLPKSYLLSSYYGPGFDLDAGETAVKKADPILTLMDFPSSGGDREWALPCDPQTLLSLGVWSAD